MFSVLPIVRYAALKFVTAFYQFNILPQPTGDCLPQIRF